MGDMDEVKQLLIRIYGDQKGRSAIKRIQPLIERFPKSAKRRTQFFSQEDIVLITYGDTLIKTGETPLKTLHRFAGNYLKDIIPAIHFLPFFPYSSDDGFSVMDFFSINPELGNWQDVVAIGQDFQLMFDFVVNHFSAESEWFQHYLDDRDGFSDFAIEADPSTDLSLVTRPRSLPLLSEFKKHDGRPVHLWTTFSADQIDFNFKSLDVLQKMIEVLLFYIEKGATILRLDAIAFLWKKIGTPCVHLPQTHDVVKLFRKILDIVSPDAILITETNVPHDENISYFGNGRDEAQMVYNFTLPPLLFHTLVKEDATVLSGWARTLNLPSEHTTFFNFCASHDGIGVRPLEGILKPEAITELIDVVKQNGGQVSYKRNPDGSDSPYELNITYVDALYPGNDANHAERFLASQSIQYVLPGVPATYIHSLLGSRNWTDGVQQTGRARTINREKLPVENLLEELRDPGSFRSRIFYPYLDMIKIRRRQEAFHPNAGYDVLDLGPKVFAVKRRSESQTIYAITNISSTNVRVALSDFGLSGSLGDILSGESFPAGGFTLGPYQYVWLNA